MKFYDVLLKSCFQMDKVSTNILVFLFLRFVEKRTILFTTLLPFMIESKNCIVKRKLSQNSMTRIAMRNARGSSKQQPK